eukprot:scaffold35714_cov57-Phaeocystis_antarctica.AAC.1
MGRRADEVVGLRIGLGLRLNHGQRLGLVRVVLTVVVGSVDAATVVWAVSVLSPLARLRRLVLIALGLIEAFEHVVPAELLPRGIADGLKPRLLLRRRRRHL